MKVTILSLLSKLVKIMHISYIIESLNFFFLEKDSGRRYVQRFDAILHV